MLTNEDVKKIIGANKEVFFTKEEIESRFDGLRQNFSDLQSTIDSYAQKADAYFQEMLLLTRRIDRLEKWAQQVGEKVGVKLEY